jgi:hypothetical protein
MLGSSKPSRDALTPPRAASAGTITASRARLGMVCTTPAKPSTGPSRPRRRVTATPRGTLAAVASSSATRVSWRWATR